MERIVPKEYEGIVVTGVAILGLVISCVTLWLAVDKYYVRKGN